MSLWNSDTIKDVAESVGIPSLNDEVARNLAMDVEYRISQVLQEAQKFMRHSKRTTLNTQDVTHALRVLNVEPLYGYAAARPLKFGEASLGQSQPIFYIEDDEVDFEKLINAPLPKIPRDVSFTSHWLAVEGVQPQVPQNPSQAEAARLTEGIPRGSPAQGSAAVAAGNGDATVKPLVKHLLSKELQLYFERVTSAVLDEENEPLREAAVDSLRRDTGLHQLLPYILQYIAEKVTHNVKNLFILQQMMHVAHALLDNGEIFLEPYIPNLVPPVLTCTIARRLGDPMNPLSAIPLRDMAASILSQISKRYGDSSHTLRPRLIRACLRHFLDPAKPFGTHYGCITSITAIGGQECVRVLILSNLKAYDEVLKKGIAEGGMKAQEAEICVSAIVNALMSLESSLPVLENGTGIGEDPRARLEERVGEIVAEHVWQLERPRLVRAILDTDMLVFPGVNLADESD